MSLFAKTEVGGMGSGKRTQKLVGKYRVSDRGPYQSTGQGNRIPVAASPPQDLRLREPWLWNWKPRAEQLIREKASPRRDKCIGDHSVRFTSPKESGCWYWKGLVCSYRQISPAVMVSQIQDTDFFGAILSEARQSASQGVQTSWRTCQESPLVHVAS